MTSPSPASVPTEEDVALAVKRAQFGSRAELSKDGPWREHELKQARAVLALFAPILAEKERETTEVTERMEEVAREWSKMLVRAQAAEAALASAREEERERCAALADSLDPNATDIAVAIRAQGE